ncbi:NUDIX hydrolase domain-like protein, partial [Multifurca ochricompacta]
GSILFASTHAPLRVCLIHHNARGQWLLPKGRKDRGENIITTAVRETFEETGYPCRLLPLDLITRAPAVGAQTADAAVLVRGSEEPFMFTIRRTQGMVGGYASGCGGGGGVQLISWFATIWTGAEKIEGVQTEDESYESAFFEIEEAMRMVTFQVDRDLIERAIELVRATYPEYPKEDRQDKDYSLSFNRSRL